MTGSVFDKVAVLGIGLLGSSIAHAVKAYGGAGEVALWDLSGDVRDRARRVVPGAVTDTADAAVADADAQMFFHPHLQGHMAVIGELDRIAKQVEQDLSQPQRIARKAALQDDVVSGSGDSGAGGNNDNQMLMASALNYDEL